MVCHTTSMEGCTGRKRNPLALREDDQRYIKTASLSICINLKKYAHLHAVSLARETALAW